MDKYTATNSVTNVKSEGLTWLGLDLRLYGIFVTRPMESPLASRVSMSRSCVHCNVIFVIYHCLASPFEAQFCRWQVSKDCVWGAIYFSEIDHFWDCINITQSSTMPELAFVMQVIDKLEQQTARTGAKVQHFKTQFFPVLAAKFEKFKAPLDCLLRCAIFLLSTITFSQPW